MPVGPVSGHGDGEVEMGVLEVGGTGTGKLEMEWREEPELAELVRAAAARFGGSVGGSRCCGT